MSKRKTYQAHELRAGRTLFIVTSAWMGKGGYQFGVSPYLVAGKREPQPDPGKAHPYRMHPKVAKHAATVTDIWRTHRAAQAEANRRQRAAQ